MNTQPTAVVLFAHGSRDPNWRAPIDAVAAEMRRQAPHISVHCAFLELMAPDLPETVDTLVKDGHLSIRIVPMFLGIGRHAREDLPELVASLRQRHPGLLLDLQPAIGEQPELTRSMARIALG
ncbi:MAG: cobalamin biosynthesis protein CbiX [Limnohabitans sp.]|nr:MAG: cobalamin biosynthesis protein CbiX [Limnohabitans sp.]